METKTYFEVLISEKERKKREKRKEERRREKKRKDSKETCQPSTPVVDSLPFFFFLSLLGILNSVSQVRRNKTSLVLLKIITKDSV